MEDLEQEIEGTYAEGRGYLKPELMQVWMNVAQLRASIDAHAAIQVSSREYLPAELLC